MDFRSTAPDDDDDDGKCEAKGESVALRLVAATDLLMGLASVLGSSSSCEAGLFESSEVCGVTSIASSSLGQGDRDLSLFLPAVAASIT